jgi:manganese/zinc/iron transport system substrate-binding protein
MILAGINSARRLALVSVVGAGLAVAALACTGTPRNRAAGLKVVASNGLVAELVKNVGGDQIMLTTTFTPGADLHSYQPGAGDRAAIADADVVFHIGLGLEPAIDSLLQLADTSVFRAALGDGLDQKLLLPSPELGGRMDPHLWLDVSLWQMALEFVTNTLVQVRPTHRVYFRANAARYHAELDTLDMGMKARMSIIPSERRVLVTGHNAFSYFGRAYGFEVLGLRNGYATPGDSAAEVVKLAGIVKERKIPALFASGDAGAASLGAVAAAARMAGAAVSVDAQLFADGPGFTGGEQAGYVATMWHNVETIVGRLTARTGGTR